jgi:hypothetical protein
MGGEGESLDLVDIDYTMAFPTQMYDDRQSAELNKRNPLSCL